MTRIAITGANGFIASHLRTVCHSKDIKVSCISRKKISVNNNETLSITKNYSETRLLKILKQCSVLVHLVGTGSQTSKNSFDYVNSTLTKNIVNLCKKAKVPKIIYLSGLGVCAKNVNDYYISKYNAEQHIINSKLNYIILRPSYIIGKDDPLTKLLNKQIKKNFIPIPGSGKYRFQPIHIDDVISFVLNIISSDKNMIIDLVGPQTVTYEKFVSLFCKYKNKTPVLSKIPLENIYRDAIRGKGEFGLDDLNIMIGDFTSSRKLKMDIKFDTIKKLLT